MDIEIRHLIKDSSLKNLAWVLAGAFFVIVVGVAIAYEEWTYLVIISIPPLLYLSMIKPFIFPFGLYLFLIPFDSILSVTGSSTGTTLTKLLGAVTILILLLKGSFERKLKWPDKAALYWALFIIIALMSIFWAIKADPVKSTMSTAVGLLALYLVISSYKIDRKEFEMCKWFILSGGFLCSIFTVYNYSSGMFYKSTLRATVAFDDRTTNPNVFAISLLIPIAICIEKIFTEKKMNIKALLAAVLGVMIFSIITSGSRGGLLSVLVVVLVYIILIKKRFSFLVAMVLMGIVLVGLTPDYFFDRIERVADTGGSGRMTIWTYGLGILKQNLLYGVGINNFATAYSEYAHFTPFSTAIYRGAHNIYIQVLVELGVIGFSIMVLSIVKHYRLLTRRYNYPAIDQTMLKASLCGILVASFYSNSIWTKSFWLLWMMILIYGNVIEGIHYHYDTRISQTRNT